MTRRRTSRSPSTRADQAPVRRKPTRPERDAPTHRAKPMAALPKLDVSDPGDPSEREADAVADRVAEGRDVAEVEPQEPAVQRQELPEAAPPTEQEDPARVQRKADGSAAVAAVASPGPGAPLPQATRAAIEPHLGTSLDHVRVHDDAASREAARSIQAKAFTSGSDIWLGPGASAHDSRLMAHEAAHVVQQGGGLDRGAPIGRVRADRQAEDDAPPADDTTTDQTASEPVTTEHGAVDLRRKRLTIEKLKIPSFKLAGTPKSGLRLAKSGTRETSQIPIWEEGVGTAADAAMDTKLEGKPPIVTGGESSYFLDSGKNVLLIGTLPDLKARARRPVWDKRGRYRTHDVDHIHEHQLGGADHSDNLWLLDSSANRSSGSAIAAEVVRSIELVLSSAKPELEGQPVPKVEDVRKAWDVDVGSVTGGLEVTGTPGAFWTATQIQGGAALQQLAVLTPEQIEERGLAGSPETLVLYLSRLGGIKREVEWGEDVTEKAIDIAIGKKGAVHLNHVSYAGHGTGTVSAQLFEGNKLLTPQSVTMDLQKIPGVGYGGYVSSRALKSRLNASLKGASPITWDTVDLDPTVGIVARGRVSPTIPLISRAGIDVVVEGADVYLEKVFGIGDFELPGPIEVTDASLVLQGGTRGLSAAGGLAFEVPNLGAGTLNGDVRLGADGLDFGLAGSFDFDTDVFETARITAAYGEDGSGAYQLNGSGTLEIGRGRIRGVRRGSIEATIEGERITAAGQVEVDAPGVESGELELVSDPGSGVQVTGKLQLSDDIPGIASGTLEATIATSEEGGYALSGAISATTDIPGIDGTVEGSYEDGAFVAAATLGYERGRLSGQVRVGATNRALVDGEPTGDATENLVAFGSGSLTLRLTDWLQGTAEVTIGPSGALTVVGEIAVPSTLDLFPEKKLEKNLFTINLDIPIVGVSVAGQNVGIFATIGGGLDARAAVGPGQLRDTSVRVTYSPDDEAGTAVHGSAVFYVPASAGLRLSVRGALGAGIPLVDARAGLEVGGTLGIDGAGRVAVAIDWTPSSGLELEGEAEVRAEPTFTFDVTGFVEVTFDYLVGTTTLYEQRWQLASFQYGSGLAVGVLVPVSWREGEPFDLSYDDIELTYPDIDPSALLRGLVDQIA